MKTNKLKKARIITSIIIFILFFLLFYGIFPQDSFIYETLTLTQFITIIINTFFNIKFILVLFLLTFLTILFGRIYCSTLCPFGTFQDIFIFLRYKFFKKKPFTKQGNNKIFRYLFVSIIFIFFILDNAVILGNFDPYSNMGRIFKEIILPPVFIISNFISGILEKFDLYVIKKHELDFFYINSFLYTLIIFIIIFFLSFFKGRFFCNNLCPAGSILGLVSKISLFKIKFSKEKCKECSLCSYMCKAGCIDYTKKEIDNEMCINCFNCIDVCPDKNINYEIVTKNKKIDISKRNFIDTTIKILSGILIFTIPQKLFANTIITDKRKRIILPPGAESLKNFNKRCISCFLCVTNCPTKVLQPKALEYGLENFLQPKMDYEKSYCLYDCNICSKVCPTDAIKKIDISQKRKTQIGVAKFEMKNCVVYEKETLCGLCNEYCPTKAVILKPYKGNLGLPFVRESMCIGCGACEYICPANPNKAIYIEGNLVQKELHLNGMKKRKRKGQN